ncbi:CG9107, partial [Drosophila busckii]
MSELSDYKVVPLRMTPDAQHCHSVYMREHFIRLMDPNKPKGRTLFMLNVPPYVTEAALSTFFSKLGKVESVLFAAKPGRDETQKWYEGLDEPFSYKEAPFKFKVAYVVFQRSSGVAKSLVIQSIDLFNSSGESLVKTGVELWHDNYMNHYLMDMDETQKKIDAYMADYDKRERAAQLAAKTTQADADGWITVGKDGQGFAQTETTVERVEERIKKDKKSKELKNFYTFQIRESKMQNVIELRKKFEEDKHRIE